MPNLIEKKTPFPSDSTRHLQLTEIATPYQHNSNNLPKISIITPSFNQVNYLEATILSVLNQNYPNLEYIIIDGGSTDGSIEIIKKYADKLTFWVSEPDNGLYHAIQKGFDWSTGEIMAWLNSDDLYHPNALLMIADIFNDFPTINWLTTIPTIFDEKGRIVRVIDPETAKWSRFRFYSGNYAWIQQESTFWRRSLWQKTGAQLNQKLRFAGDFDLWLRFFRHEKLYFVPTLTGGFRQRSKNQLSLDNMDKYIEEAENCLIVEKLNLSLSEKIKTYLFRLDGIIKSIPKIRGVYRLLKISENYFAFPKEIIFDRTSQTFIYKR
jgi:glycosyltransferase involved in cell wall biosynthesis